MNSGDTMAERVESPPNVLTQKRMYTMTRIYQLLQFFDSRVLPVVKQAEAHSGSFYGRSLLVLIAGVVLVLMPLVSFEAGGGKSAIGITQYIAFRGLDRDLWWLYHPVSLLAGVFGSLSVLVGFVLHVVGLMFRDRTLALWGSGTTALGLLMVVLGVHPVASYALFNTVALPHIGWFMAVAYTAISFRLLLRWDSATATEIRVGVVREGKVINV